MKAALWLRVSTQEQETANQLPQMERVIQARSLVVVRKWEFDGSAWKGDNRPELMEMLRAARDRQFDTLVIWSLDRLTRQGPLDALQIIHELARAGVTVVSCQEPWLETSGVMRDLLISLTGWVAEFESKRHSERVRAGIEQAKREGKHLGRPPGAKDRKPRRKAGYYARAEGRRLER
jgi:putative DNA-invertase from lambdoid prophage Rac